MRVAVIGNGPVGQTTALLLARWGVPVVLLDDRAERNAAGSKAICQQGDVLDIWDCVGAGRHAAHAAHSSHWRHRQCEGLPLCEDLTPVFAGYSFTKR
jgi:2-polyprenyl-6-methoxyphenol hydroxylase-like FAD-dependent oxidoreductase